MYAIEYRKAGTMKTYVCKFIGRTVGAIGIFYPITVTVHANSPEDANLKLYDYYEHIQRLEVTEVSTEVSHV